MIERIWTKCKTASGGHKQKRVHHRVLSFVWPKLGLAILCRPFPVAALPFGRRAGRRTQPILGRRCLCMRRSRPTICYARAHRVGGLAQCAVSTQLPSQHSGRRLDTRSEGPPHSPRSVRVCCASAGNVAVDARAGSQHRTEPGQRMLMCSSESEPWAPVLVPKSGWPDFRPVAESSAIDILKGSLARARHDALPQLL